MSKHRRRNKYNKYGRKRTPAAKILAAVLIPLAILCAAVFAFLYFFYIPGRESADENVVYESMTAASLPTLAMIYDGCEVNTLYGYTQEMDTDYIHGSVYVLDDGYDIPFVCTLYGNEIDDITFSVRSIGKGSLIQTGTVSGAETEDDVMSFDIGIDNIIEDGTEYMLTLDMTSSSGEEIYYYIRIIKDETSLSSQLEGVLEFNSMLCDISDEDAKSYVTGYLQTDYTLDSNEDFGNVSLVSSVYSMMWNRMSFSVYGDIGIEILDVDGDIGYIRLNYMLTRTSDDITEYYNVSEFYRVRMVDDNFRILDYERQTDQVFEPSSETISTQTALLGIISDSDIEMQCSPDGELSCFVYEGGLWAMDTDEKEIRLVFSFSSGLDDVRGNHDEYDIKIVDVADDGTIQFLVYGYMNAGLHEGKVGIGVYTYDPEEESVSEDVFITTELTFDILDNSIGELVYMNENGELYLMTDESLYLLDLEARNAECIVTDLSEGNYVIQPSGYIIAWHDGGSVNGAESITVLNMETGESYGVSAESGSCIKALGFLGEDFVYGQGVSGETYADSSGTEYLLMTDMYVIDSDGQIQSENSSGSAYYIGAEAEYNRIIIDQVTEEDGAYTETETFTVFSTELDDQLEMEITSDYIDIKKTVYYVNFAGSTTSAGDLTIDEATQVLFAEANTIDISGMIDAGGKYYVYAKGELKLMTESPADAVNTAYEETGVVVTDTGELFYKRTLVPSEVELSDVAFSAAVENAEGGTLTDISGISLVELLYFMSIKTPVIWEYEGETYLIYGYDYETSLFLYNLETGEESEFSYSDAEEVFAETMCWLISD